MVDWEAARRQDPQLSEGAVRAMSAEKEVKKAMGRDAKLLKARADPGCGGVAPA